MTVMKKIAIYARKSKFTGKGDSVVNQIDTCRDYIKKNFQEYSYDDILVFEDEGKSGKNMNRPQFKQMMKKCRDMQISTVICYKLDRISRNINDFSSMYNEFQKLQIQFVSVSDNFDTATAAGRAMMYIVSVFAEFERDIIAERIQDNMYALSKSGRWLGGTTPLGYKSVATTGSVTVDGKEHTARMLEQIHSECDTVKLMYKTFLDIKSLTKLDEFCLSRGMHTRQNKQFTRDKLKPILQNPVYMIADEDAWNYFESQGIKINADKKRFDGTHGIMAYNKTDQKGKGHHKTRAMSDWIISVGKHNGIISGKDWVRVQEILDQNSNKSYRKPKSNDAILSGILVCKNCGSFMRPKKRNGRTNKYGDVIYNYICELKSRNSTNDGVQCHQKNITHGELLDKFVCGLIAEIIDSSSDFSKKVSAAKKELFTENDNTSAQIKQLEDQIKEVDTKIKIFKESLSNAKNDLMIKEFTCDIDNFYSQKEVLLKRKDELEEISKKNKLSTEKFDEMYKDMSDFSANLDTMSAKEKNEIIRKFIKRIEWDGEFIHITYFGSKDSVTVALDEGTLCGCSKRNTYALSFYEKACLRGAF